MSACAHTGRDGACGLQPTTRVVLRSGGDTLSVCVCEYHRREAERSPELEVQEHGY